jgi:hypothetical protein
VIALGLLTASACCHAAWNLLLKRGGLGGPAFVWLCGLLTLPISLVLLVRGSLATVWWAGLVSMALHTTYAVTLQKAYALGEFTMVYPLSRGTAPALVTVAALPSHPQPYVGAALVLAGVLVLDRPRPRAPARGVVLGLAVAGCTAAYTLWDGFAIRSLGVDVLTYLAVAIAQRALGVLDPVLPVRDGRADAIDPDLGRGLRRGVGVAAAAGRQYEDRQARESGQIETDRGKGETGGAGHVGHLRSPLLNPPPSR